MSLSQNKPTVRIVVNNGFSRIHYDESLYNDYFQNCMLACDFATAFFVKDYQLSSRFLTGEWDGKRHQFNPWLLRQYNLQPLGFYTGKIAKVMEVILHWGYGIELIDNRICHAKHQIEWDWESTIRTV
jgi:hypothetical protein